jgi:hypothetical protein
MTRAAIDRLPRRPALATATLAVLCSLAACGSTARQTTSTAPEATVDQAAQGALPETTAQPAGDLPPAGTVAVVPSTGDPAPAAGRPSSRSAGIAKAGRTSSGAQKHGGGASSAPTTTTTTATPANLSPIEIGVGVGSNGAQAAAAVGYSLDYGDGKQQANAIISDINAHGGLNGHPIVPVFGVSDATDTRDAELKQSSRCATYTQDHHVVAVTGALGATPNGLSCFNKAGVAYFSTGGGSYWDTTIFSSFPLVVSPGMLEADRIYPVLIQRLKARGFFSPWGAYPTTRVGLVSTDDKLSSDMVERVIKPAAKAQGITIDPVVYVHCCGGDQEVRDIQSAVLKMSTENVSHVLFQDPEGGGLEVYFLKGAQTQRYFPRYAIHSAFAPAILLSVSGNADQLKGAMGVGWNPLVDVDEAHDQVSARNPAWVKCKSVMEAAGVNMSVRLTAYVAVQYCDTLYALQAAVRGQSTLTGKSTIDGALRLGTTFQAAGSVLGTNLTPSHPAGVGAVRDLTYDDGCQCFTYGDRAFPV